MTNVDVDPAAPRRLERNRFLLALHLSRRPWFCCCCLCLTRREGRRAKRILRIVRSATRDWPRHNL